MEKPPIIVKPHIMIVAMLRTACLRNNTGKNAITTGNVTGMIAHAPLT